jgi:hypothetical protein
MADVKVIFPTMPKPSKEYDPQMLGDFIRSIEQLMVILKYPGEGRHSKLSLTHLPTSDSGLEAGALYAMADGIVRISQLNLAALTGFTIASGIGSVTVTIV